MTAARNTVRKTLIARPIGLPSLSSCVLRLTSFCPVEWSRESSVRLLPPLSRSLVILMTDRGLEMHHNHSGRIIFVWFWSAVVFHALAVPLLAIAARSSPASMAGSTPQRRATPPEIWQGIFTDQQAARGKTEFQAHCATCHDSGALGEAPPLAGDTFLRSWEGHSLGRLYTKILQMMPPSNVEGVSPMQKLDVLTFILHENGFPSGSHELTADARTLARIHIVPEGGPAPLRTGAMVQTVGCLTQGPAKDWLLVRGTEPAASTLDPPSAADLDGNRTRPLGNQSIRLMSVFPSPEALIGYRVEAKGLLVRTGTDVAINVVALKSVAPTCP